MKKTVLLYGLLAGVLIAALKVIEYRFLVVQHSFEIYGGLVAILFAGLGLWLGRRITRPRPIAVVPSVEGREMGFQPNLGRYAQLGITPREREILELIAAGLSNQEIAEKLFVSQNTVKTHASRLFDKLDARRRTQAVQIAKREGLIP